MKESGKYRAVVVGASAGGLNALKILLRNLDRNFRMPVIIVQHISPDADNYLVHILNDLKGIRVKEADEKEHPQPGYAYVAPPNYHLMLEPDLSFTLTVDERVNYARPSIDVLFETAANAYRGHLVGVILTGANNDGSLGLRRIKELGGFAIVQDPDTAEVDSMPRAAIQNCKVDKVLSLEEIAVFLNQIE
jgi:two-component system chemotaxis response regulator CheB